MLRLLLTRCTVFDLVNVAETHNSTFDPNNIVTSSSFSQLRTLADAHEWGLAYNSSDDMRAVAGMTLAAQVLQFLNGTITSDGKQKIGIQFGNYATMASYFGLADLPAVNPDFYGVSDYASALTWELFTNSSTAVTSSSYPSEDEMYVRFLFHNGTTSNISEPVAYPLFGTGQEAISWNDFVTGMDKFALGTTEAWCTACGNFTGTCAAYASSGSGSSSSGGSSSSSSDAKAYKGNGLSPAVNGVIGALVALAVVLGLEALIMLLGGMRLVSKKRLARSGSESVTSVDGNGVGKVA